MLLLLMLMLMQMLMLLPLSDEGYDGTPSEPILIPTTLKPASRLIMVPWKAGLQKPVSPWILL